MAQSDHQVLLIAEASILLPSRAAVLSDFEIELVAECGFRLIRQGASGAVITDAEQPVLEAAIDAMRGAQRVGRAA